MAASKLPCRRKPCRLVWVVPSSPFRRSCWSSIRMLSDYINCMIIAEAVDNKFSNGLKAANPHSCNNLCIFFNAVTAFYTAVINSVLSKALSCKILLRGRTISNTSCFTAIKTTMSTLAICCSNPCNRGTHFFIDALWGEDICWLKKPINTGNFFNYESIADTWCSTHRVPVGCLYFACRASINEACLLNNCDFAFSVFLLNGTTVNASSTLCAGQSVCK